MYFIYVWEYGHMCVQYRQRPEEGDESPEVGVIGVFEVLDWMLRIGLKSSARATSAVNHLSHLSSPIFTLPVVWLSSTLCILSTLRGRVFSLRNLSWCFQCETNSSLKKTFISITLEFKPSFFIHVYRLPETSWWDQELTSQLNRTISILLSLLTKNVVTFTLLWPQFLTGTA